MMQKTSVRHSCNSGTLTTHLFILSSTPPHDHHPPQPPARSPHLPSPHHHPRTDHTARTAHPSAPLPRPTSNSRCDFTSSLGDGGKVICATYMALSALGRK
ncbi:hypothetical protein OH76DRAFT_249211 [Lentinus brumalis]|uniref:Uncharacterized protein n=1 Tax=Lentinus brumalis TaxID=2498619 RepID=A0A371CLL3_9APHY|nr:hypothetical protein OH76DRAFT_249211 [Polyporus brumalis]